ncbi:hypothetical protein Ancab_029789 [Ancistrocladus abbreviatus]
MACESVSKADNQCILEGSQCSSLLPLMVEAYLESVPRPEGNHRGGRSKYYSGADISERTERVREREQGLTGGKASDGKLHRQPTADQPLPASDDKLSPADISERTERVREREQGLTGGKASDGKLHRQPTADQPLPASDDKLHRRPSIGKRQQAPGK